MGTYNEVEYKNALEIVNVYQSEMMKTRDQIARIKFESEKNRNEYIESVVRLLDLKFGICNDKRFQDNLFPRYAAMEWLHQNTKYSLYKIGQLCGGKDHSTVIHARKQYIKLTETNFTKFIEFRDVVFKEFEGLELNSKRK